MGFFSSGLPSVADTERPPPEPPLRDSARAAFLPLSEKCEGVVNHLYLDIKGNVTVAIGVLCPLHLALSLDWRYDEDPSQKASAEDIEREWRLINGRKDLAQAGAGAARKLCAMHLPTEAMMGLVEKELDGMVAVLARRFAHFKDWPAAAQLATVSLSWAYGPEFEKEFPKTEAALQAGDFTTAAKEGQLSETGNGGVHRRNVAQRALYTLAAKWEQDGFDWDDLGPYAPPEAT